ncbi:MAG: NADH-quinone oxidoreductase subunit NuoK [Anaerolineae bacterium]|nr:NADH-quinone oxidoreductase subunit NuoK [Anaerolineae bacterium]
MIPLSWYLIFSAALFSIGLFGVLARKNVIGMLMGVELMLNAVNINLLAFWSYLYAGVNGLVFVAIVFVAAAAEVAVGLALIISIYRRKRTVVPDEVDGLRG